MTSEQGPLEQETSSRAGVPTSAAAALACLELLKALQARGLSRLVLCPGSRSAPLAVAASLLEQQGFLEVHTAIDERSAAFFALGLARGEGRAVAVVTTSGSAVANLLPALVEADHSTIPLLLLTADRPQRLKGCGANQTVNQEDFLRPCCRWFGQGSPQGLTAMAPPALRQLALEAMAAASGLRGEPAGPAHLNLPLEEPLHPDADALAWLHNRVPPCSPATKNNAPDQDAANPGPWTSLSWGDVGLDPDEPGLVVAGPWRGCPASWPSYLQALKRWQQRSGWPVLADALSGLRGVGIGDVVAGYDLLLERPSQPVGATQVLRLGPLAASRRLQAWLAEQRGAQVLVTEGDRRPQDPLQRIQGQWSGGLAHWPGLARLGESGPSPEAIALRDRWLGRERQLQALLTSQWPEPSPKQAPVQPGTIDEPWLARRLGQLLPPDLAVMLANSSPVRDWESFADPAAPGRAIYSFRGASGIDGTLSIACGLAEVVGNLVLVSGDLALQHDSNGWLWRSQLRGRLLVVLIDNGGGGIFEQLPIRPADPAVLDFERLFAMPQAVDPTALAAAYGVPGREVRQPGELAEALRWGLAQPMALLRVLTDRTADAARRRQLRTMAAERISPP